MVSQYWRRNKSYLFNDQEGQWQRRLDLWKEALQAPVIAAAHINKSKTWNPEFYTSAVNSLTNSNWVNTLQDECEKLFNNHIWGILLFSHVWLFQTPWTEACQASLSLISRICKELSNLNNNKENQKWTKVFKRYFSKDIKRLVSTW